MAKVAFIQDELRTREGIMILSAILKKHGHDTDVFSKCAENDLITSVLDYHPDVIALSCSTYEHKFALECAREIKTLSPSQFIIMGGPHPTFFPEVIDDSALDAVCVGEGEGAMLDLVQALDDSRPLTGIENWWIKVDGGQIERNPVRAAESDLDAIAFPDRKLLLEADEFTRQSGIKHFITSRGCPYDCTYCFNHALAEVYRGKGKRLRQMSVDKVIEEVR